MLVRNSDFALFADSEEFPNPLQCVLLNGCYSQPQAEAIASHVPYVIGMARAIKDSAAIEFAVGFYDALGAGRSVESAFKFGCSAMQIAGLNEHSIPVLIKGPAEAMNIESPPEKAKTVQTSGTRISGNRMIGKKQSIKVAQQDAQVENNWMEGEEQSIDVE